MIKVECETWEQSVRELQELALHAPHPRTRERFLALFLMVSEGICAREVARRTGRVEETVQDWVHKYNAQGPEALTYRRSGGRRPFALQNKPPGSSTS